MTASSPQNRQIPHNQTPDKRKSCPEFFSYSFAGIYGFNSTLKSPFRERRITTATMPSTKSRSSSRRSSIAKRSSRGSSPDIDILDEGVSIHYPLVPEQAGIGKGDAVSKDEGSRMLSPSLVHVCLPFLLIPEGMKLEASCSCSLMHRSPVNFSFEMRRWTFYAKSAFICQARDGEATKTQLASPFSTRDTRRI